MARLVRKNVFFDVRALRRAQKILRLGNESATIRQAIDMVAFRRSAMQDYDKVAGKSPRFRDPWKRR